MAMSLNSSSSQCVELEDNESNNWKTKIESRTKFTNYIGGRDGGLDLVRDLEFRRGHNLHYDLLGR